LGALSSSTPPSSTPPSSTPPSSTASSSTPRSAHVLWVGVMISLIIALYFAYHETISETNNPLNFFLPQTNITIAHYIQNSTTTIITHDSKSNVYLTVPQIPRWIFIWGFIGAAAYLLKVVTGYIGGGTYKPEFLPYHIARLFLGPALAAVVYFILETGSFFGLSFDVTKTPIPLLPYLYAGVAFITGYSVRGIIETISKMVNSIFNV
jgi:hypothetical protein